MKRAYVFKEKWEENGKLMVVDDTLDDFLLAISVTFNIAIDDIKLYAKNGCEIDDIRVIRDNEKVYLTQELSAKGLKKEENQDPLEKESFKKVSEGIQNISIGEWITLNVGGKRYTTSRTTLQSKEPQSMLARMFANENNVLLNPSSVDSTGAYLIDRSSEYFEPILNYLRHGDIIIDKNVNPNGVLKEALFYGIESMIPQLNELIAKSECRGTTCQALTRQDIVRSLIVTTHKSELRFQGVNLAGADLNRLDLRNINFKYACLSRCNLNGANLSYCCLERADLSHAYLEGAQLLGVKALCANMEGANLRGSNMEDPHGSRAVMEGVNLKGANLEGSNMAGVNLRVATLKNANLQNCDLRAAVLAGADLESCDLSGSDLHEANLRGANLKDAAFELMLTPLHMSQTIR